MEPEVIFDVKSRPEYSAVLLNPDSSFHLFIAEGALPAEIHDLYQACSEADKALLDGLAQATDLDGPLENYLSTAPLNSTVYLTGSESFIWMIANKLKALGLVNEHLRMFKSESKQRRIYCLHCRAFTENVTLTPLYCSDCQRLLNVSDHFSRRLSAYMAYQVNAEDPMDIPQTEELS